MSHTMTEFELNELQVRLTETEHQLFEGELLQKKLHNTILETYAYSAECALCYQMMENAKKPVLLPILLQLNLVGEASMWSKMVTSILSLLIKSLTMELLRRKYF